MKKYVFVQEYDSSNNKKYMEGTKDFPFRFVGELVSYENSNLVVRHQGDDSVCCAPVMHDIFRESLINLSIDGIYLIGINFIKTKSSIKRNYLYTTFVLHIGELVV